MVIGHPDWETFAGRSVAGREVKAANFTGTIAAGLTGTVTFTIVPTGEEHIYQHLTVACDNDTAMHFVDFYRNSDLLVFYTETMITSFNAEFPGQAVSAGDVVKLEITNNAAVSVDFFGTIFWVVRQV